MENLGSLAHLGGFVYSFRVDLDSNKHELCTQWLLHFNIRSYLLCHEYSDLDKPHFQGVIFTTQSLNSKEIVARRNWWRGKTNTTSQSVSLTKCYSTIRHLVKYVLKHKHTSERLISNISDKDQVLLLKLKTNLERKKDKKDKLHSAMLDYCTQPRSFGDFCEQFTKVYHTIYSNYPRVRTQYFINAYKYKIISHEQYMHSIGVFRDPTPYNSSHFISPFNISNSNTYSQKIDLKSNTKINPKHALSPFDYS